MSLSNLLDKVYNNIFKFNDTSITVLFDKNNTIWLSYNSILKSLGYSDIKKLKKRLSIDSEYFSDYNTIYPQSKLNKIKHDYQKPNEKYINEAGMYQLLNKSSKKIAAQLSNELFTKVLPEIRKTGKFILNSTEKQNMNKLTKKIKAYQTEIKRTKKQIHIDETGNGFIYILKIKTLKDGKTNTCYKIGYTSDLDKRMATYKTGNPDIELVHHENIKCNKKQLEKCVMNLNTLKLLKNKAEVICNVPLKKLIGEINDCKQLLLKYTNSTT